MIARIITQEEHLEFSKLATVAFVSSMDIEKKREELAKGSNDYKNIWGYFDNDNHMTAGMINNPYEVLFDGHIVKMSGIGAVCSYPEMRMRGGIKTIFRELFKYLREDGYVFSVLYPFSHDYYRQFGYELCYTPLRTKLPLTQLKQFKQLGTAKMHLKDEPYEEIKQVYNTFISNYNLAIVRNEEDWKRMLSGCPYENRAYRYLLWDENGTPNAYINFSPVRVEDENMISVKDMAFTDPKALHSLLGFIYKLSAQYKEIEFELPSDIDVVHMIGNPYTASQKAQYYGMARIMDVKTALQLMRHPAGSGTYSIEVSDTFVPENSGTYTITYSDDTVDIIKSSKEADLVISIQALSQLVTGYISLTSALWRTDVLVKGNMEILKNIFVQKPRYFIDRF